MASPPPRSEGMIGANMSSRSRRHRPGASISVRSGIVDRTDRSRPNILVRAEHGDAMAAGHGELASEIIQKVPPLQRGGVLDQMLIDLLRDVIENIVQQR